MSLICCLFNHMEFPADPVDHTQLLVEKPLNAIQFPVVWARARKPLLNKVMYIFHRENFRKQTETGHDTLVILGLGVKITQMAIARMYVLLPVPLSSHTILHSTAQEQCVQCAGWYSLYCSTL